MATRTCNATMSTRRARNPTESRITVVIAARDVERFIAETVASVQRQALDGWRLILVVDSATDATAEVARRQAAGDSRIDIIEASLGGVSRARNLGLEHCRTAFVLFLDGDDLLTEDSLQRFVGALAVPAAPVAAVAAHAKIDEAGKPIAGEGADSRPAFPAEGAWPGLLSRNVIVNGGTIAMRTDKARAAGGFDPDLRIGEDWEFWVRLALQGDFVSLGRRPSLLYRQRRHSAMTRVHGQGAMLETAAIDKIFGNAELAQRFPADRLRRFRRAALIDMRWTAVRAALHRRQWRRFAGLAAASIIRFPDSLMQPYLWRYLLQRITGRTVLQRS